MTFTEATNFCTALYYREGSSDKAYVVEVVHSGVGYAVQFAYGRRGSTLTTGCKTPRPVTFDEAMTIAQKLVAEKKAKGYTEASSGTRYLGTDHAGQMSIYLPQLLNPVDDYELAGLLDDPGFAAQEKIDGRRLILISHSQVVQAVNRRGLFVDCPAHWAVGSGIDFVLDGEGVGDTFHAFDLIALNGRSLVEAPFTERYRLLETLMDVHPPVGVVLVLATAIPSLKRTWLEQLRAQGREGIVFKSLAATYTPGRPASGGSQYKYKFTESGTFIVSKVSDRKRSVSVAALDASGNRVELGNVTVPPNHAIPEVESLVEVQYLYRYCSGCLFQPVYLGAREDMEQADAKLSQIRRIKQASLTQMDD